MTFIIIEMLPLILKYFNYALMQERYLILFILFNVFLPVTNPIFGQEKKNKPAFQTVSVNEFDRLLVHNVERILLDVRSEKEFEDGHLINALNYNINDTQFENKISRLDKSKPVFVYCLAGSRSARASEMLIHKGFTAVYNLDGGIMKWKAANKPVESSGNIMKKGISAADFYKETNSQKLVLVDFYGSWCGPCKKMMPYLEKIAQEKTHILKLLKIDIDQNAEIVESKKLDGVPYLELYKEGKLIWTQRGFIDEKSLYQVLNKY